MASAIQLILGLFKQPQRQTCGAEIVVRGPVVGRQLNCPAERFDGVGKLSLRQQRRSQNAMRLRKRWIDGNRAAQLGDRVVEPALAKQKIAEIEPCFDAIRMQLNRAAVAGLGWIELPELGAGVAEGFMIVGERAVGRDRMLHQVARVLVASALMRHHAK